MDSYIQRKIDHMKRIGVIGANSQGVGKNGGAAPDWMQPKKIEQVAEG